jgi:hypothetical protein
MKLLEKIGVGCVILMFLLCGTSASGPASQETSPYRAGSDADLARQLSDPVASLVSVPFEFSCAQPVGLDDDSRFSLIVQPVIPFTVNDDVKLVVRWISPTSRSRVSSRSRCGRT